MAFIDIVLKMFRGMYRFGLGKNGRAKRLEADFVGMNNVRILCSLCLSKWVEDIAFTRVVLYCLNFILLPPF